MSLCYLYNIYTVMIRLSGHICSRPKVPDKRVFRITESPIGPDLEIGSRIFVRTSEISGLSEPGLTNHHCIYIPICNTKQYIYQTKYAVLHHSRIYNNVYMVSGVHVCDNVI